MHRQLGVRSLADECLGNGAKGKLDRILELLDWSRFAVIIKNVHDAAEGRPAFPPVLLFKAMLLAQWYKLSDAALEEALLDRISFRRFVGLTMADPTPDQVTLWRFRQELSKHERHERLMKELERQFERKGLILKHGTLMDATLVEAQAASPSNEDRSTNSSSEVDPDARWMHRPGGNVFGYKAHIAVDWKSGLIRRAFLTPANVNETSIADALICGDEQMVYADKAYDSKARRARLSAMGIGDGIMHRGNKYHPEPPEEKERNKTLGHIRGRVESIFGTLKRSYGYTRVRYFSLERNATHLSLLAMAMNLRRALVLTT
jgi:IS5 family transposase